LHRGLLDINVLGHPDNVLDVAHKALVK